MTTKKITLDVEMIGDQKGLTIEEEKSLSEYFKNKSVENLRISSLKEKKKNLLKNNSLRT